MGECEVKPAREMNVSKRTAKAKEYEAQGLAVVRQEYSCQQTSTTRFRMPRTSRQSDRKHTPFHG